MSADRDVTRTVRSWLEEGITSLPDPVLDAVLDQLPTTPQRRATWWPARRFPEMNTFAKTGLAVAAVLVAALLGYGYLGNGGVGGPGVEDPTATPAVTPLPIPPAGTSMEPGTYLVSSAQDTPVTAEFDVPAGWTAQYTGAMAKNPDGPAEVGVGFTVVTHVYADACQSEGTLTEIGSSSEDLVGALLAQENIAADGPTDLTIGGHPAQRVDLGYPPALDTSACRHPGELIQVWADEAETSFFALPNNTSGSVYVVDVDGERVVVLAVQGSDSTDEDIAQVDAIVDSITFGE